MQAKSKTEQCQCAFKYHSSARKRERECYNYVYVQFSVGVCQLIHICVHIYKYVLVRVCVRQGVPVCVNVSMCRWGVGVSCVLVCRRPWMLSRLQLGTAVVHVQCRKQQEQATYKLNGHTLKISTFTLASSRAIKQAIDTRIVLGCQSEQEVQVIFRFICKLTFSDELLYIRLIPV